MKRRLARLEKQWDAGWRAPHEAIRLCVEAGVQYPPQWAYDALIKYFTIGSADSKVRVRSPHPLTGPEMTRIRALMADRLVDRRNVTIPAAAKAAVETMAEAGWDRGERVVVRVIREMSKLVKDAEARTIHYPPDWDARVEEELGKQGKTRR